MKKELTRRIGTILLIAIIIFSGMATMKVDVHAADGSTTVYATKTGECYHSAGCSSLRKSKIAMTLQEATSAGLRACKKCKPPVLTAGGTSAGVVPQTGVSGKTTVVYISTVNVDYHKVNSCGNMKMTDALPIAETEAMAYGFTKCKKCWK